MDGIYGRLSYRETEAAGKVYLGLITPVMTCQVIKM
jgi:hypothetical protein